MNRKECKEMMDKSCLKPKVKMKLKGSDEVWVPMDLFNYRCPSKVYYISDLGRIAQYFENEYKVIFDPSKAKQKSEYFVWGINKVNFPVHRLVLCHFTNTPMSSEKEVHHINGIKKDNRLENLELLTHKEHYYKEVSQGFRPCVHSMRVQKRKYNEEQVKDMRERFEKGESASSIAHFYSDKPGTIRQIVKRITYKDME